MVAGVKLQVSAWRSETTPGGEPPGPPFVRLALLALTLAAGALVAFEPHWDPFARETYPYPAHLDEYVHWGYAQQVMEDESVNIAPPFGSGEAGEFSFGDDLHRRGFQAYVGALQAVTGIGWIPLFVYAPALVMVLLILAVYVLAERWGAGVEAAALTILIPTTMRFLGPGFLVPIAFSLPFLVAALFVMIHGERARGMLALALLAAAMWPLHAMAGLASFAFGLVHAIVVYRSDPTRAVWLALLVAIPAAIALPVYDRFLDDPEVDPTLPGSHDQFRLFGALPILLAGAGALLLSRTRAEVAATTTLAFAWLACAGIVIYRLETGVDPFNAYDRVHMVFYVVSAILGGVGLARLLALAQRVRVPRVAFPVGTGLLVVGILAAGTAIALEARDQYEVEKLPVLSDSTYAAYVGAAPLLPPGKALVDGLPTMPFTTITGHRTHFVFTPGTGATPLDIELFFDTGASDTYFLVKNRITIVATERPVSNPDLVPVVPGVYVLRADYASRIPPMI